MPARQLAKRRSFGPRASRPSNGRVWGCLDDTWSSVVDDDENLFSIPTRPKVLVSRAKCWVAMASLTMYVLLFCFLAISTRIYGDGLASTPPRGWNSYDSFSWTVSEQEFLENARNVADTLLPFGYEYVVIDFLWFRKLENGASVQSPGHDIVDEWGRPVPDPKRWPSTAGGKGFAPIAQKVHSMGLKFGIHVMRGISTAAVSSNTPILGAEGWRAKDIALTNQPCPWMQDCFVSVNTSSEGGKAFLKSLYDQYASWEVDFVKHDCVFGADNINLDEIQAVSKAIVNTGRPIVYSLSPGVQATPKLAANVNNLVHMYRVTGDDWDRWGDVAAHFDVAKSFAAAGLIGAPGLGGGKSWPDLDMLPLGWLTDPGAPYGPYRSSRLSLDEQKSQLTLWAMAKSPLMFGGDLRHIDQTTYSLITNPTILEINAHSSENAEFSAGSLPGAEALPLLTLTACDGANATQWSIQGERRPQLCWRTVSGSEELSGCFNWTSTSYHGSSSLRELEEKGLVQLWTSEFGDLCLDTQPNIVNAIGLFGSKRFSLCSMQNSQSWTLAHGKLISEATKLCAVMTSQAPVRIWLARGPKDQLYVAFFNLGENATTIRYPLSSTANGLTKSTATRCTGEEVWSRSELDKVENLSTVVQPHSCALFSLQCEHSSSSATM